MIIELAVLDVGTRALIGFAIIFVIVAVSAFVMFILQSKKMITVPVDDEYLSLDAAYFHELGKRERQEDAYYISPMGDIKKYGFVVCIADGMGGMKYGKDIADKIVERIEKSYPIPAVILTCEKKRNVKIFLLAFICDLWAEWG